MILANLRAGLWKYLAIAGGVLAVALLVTALLFRSNYVSAAARADAFEQRAQASEAELRQVTRSEQANADATEAARTSAANRRTEQAARAARVKGYADAAGDVCVPDADLMRELGEGAERIRAAEGGLRSK